MGESLPPLSVCDLEGPLNSSGGLPYYVKLRAEADLDFFREQSGRD